MKTLWESFGRCLLYNTANPARFGWKWANLAVLFSKQLPKGSHDFSAFIFFNSLSFWDEIAVTGKKLCTLSVVYLDFILLMIIDKFSPVLIIIINNFVNKCWQNTYKWMSDKCTGCKIIHNSNFFWHCKSFRQVKNFPHNYFLGMLEIGTFKSC